MRREPNASAWVGRARRTVALAGLCAFALLIWVAAPAQAAEEKTFEFTGVEQEFTIPTGVYHIKVDLVGGIGGAGTASGGEAAEVVTGLDVTPGETLYIEVGGKGKDSGEGSAGGFNGGAAGGGGAGGGGGASDIRTVKGTTPLSTEDTRLVVAAGGGGGAGEGENAGGQGGNAGEAGGTSEGGNEGGGAGTSSTGGPGGFGCSESGAGGELGGGGAGGPGWSTNSGGGGGGGVWGGGGGGGGCSAGGGGGGGGSSLASGGIQSWTSGDPNITIIWFPPPTVSITTPADGATYTQGQAVNADYSCDPGEGTLLKSCTGPVANGAAVDTSTVGEHEFTVDAEDMDAGKASEVVTYTVVAKKEEPGPGPGPGPAPGPGPSSAPPNTVLGSHPKRTIRTKKKKVKVKFSFSAEATGATFECKLDGRAFAPCASPKAYKVRRGKHAFQVRAAVAGKTDPTPASFSFKVKKKS